MNQKIKKDFDEIFAELESHAKAFNKKTYEELFLSDYEKYKGTFEVIIEEYNAADDSNEYIQQVAEYLPHKMHKELMALPNKRKKEQYLMTRNLGMVAFVIPMFLYGRNEILNQVAEQLVKEWNDHEIDMKIGSTTFEEIKGGFKNHMCYITTAVCECLGKPDDCYELTVLRNYRDTYLAGTQEGQALIEKYYDIAPTIVSRINKEENANNIYEKIWTNYLKPCVSFVENNQMEECCELYSNMVYSLQKKFMEKNR